jgi:hypothetical protein
VDLGSAYVAPLKRRRVADEEASLCPHCKAFLFAAEAGSKDVVKSRWCCSQGELVAPRLRRFEAEFYTEGDFILPAFRDATRKLNNMASMSTSGVSGRWVTKPFGTSMVKIQGKTYHTLRSLNDPRGKRYNQLCIVDPDYRQGYARTVNVDPRLTSNVFEFLFRSNPLYQLYKTLGSMPAMRASLLFKKKPRGAHEVSLGNAHEHQKNLMPTSDEISGVLSLDEEAGPREVRIWAHGEESTKTLSYLDPSFDALSFPLLRPYADASWDPDMKGKDGKRKITQAQYHRQLHLCAPRMWEMGRLGQEAVVDAFSRVENERLNWVRHNQATLRQGSREEVARKLGEDGDGADQAGRQLIILPATFTNSPRQMRQLYHDAMRTVAAKGKPSFFITFTCNPRWPEISAAFPVDPQNPGTAADEAAVPMSGSRKRKGATPAGPSNKFCRRPTDCPSVIARVFKLKAAMLMKDLREGKVFGSRAVYSMEAVEYQDRGLPHVHILVKMEKEIPADEIDKYISARIPGLDQPSLRQKCLKHQVWLKCLANDQFLSNLSRQVHGPCGQQLNARSPCMDKGHCTKRYPMPYEEKTHVDEKGFPHYARSADNTATIRRIGRDFTIDDSFIVPYNPLLLEVPLSHHLIT